jgi:transposase
MVVAARMEGMDANTLFSQALGLGTQWKVVHSEMDVTNRRLSLVLDFEAGSRFACPRCGQLCGAHDTAEKRWRHLDFWQHRTELQARVPRVACPEHGVLQVEVPWARAESGFTLMMEGMLLLLAEQMSVSAVARLFGINDHRVWRVMDHYVMKAHAAKDWSGVRKLMVDETSAKRGHRYVTNVIDADSGSLLLMVKGRSAHALAEAAAAMPSHGARPGQITEIVMDMSPAYIAGAAAHFPQARVVFDLFHIMKLAGEALDKVRKALRREGADLAGGLWALRGNPWTRSEEQRQLREELKAAYPALGRAVILREALQGALASGQREQLQWWMSWADRSRLPSFRHLSKTLKRHMAGVLAYMETRLTNGAMEAINGVLQLAKRIARGFRNFHYFRLAAYLKAGKLNLETPRLLPT